MNKDIVRNAVREWGANIRTAVSQDAAAVPRDPPTETQTPRAAALIGEDEAMSAGGAAALDDVRHSPD